MICEKCGAKLDDDALFCPSCGKQTTLSNKSNLNKSLNSDGANNISPYKQDDPVKKQKKTTQAMVIIAVVLFAIVCVIIVYEMLKSKMSSNMSYTSESIETPEESTDTIQSENLASDKLEAAVENKANVQDNIPANLSKDEALSALKDIDSLMSNYIFVTLMESHLDSTGAERDIIPINLTEAEMIRASVLASTADGIIDGYFTYENNTLELYEDAIYPDIAMYHGVSVSAEAVEKNCLNLFGANANWDTLQTSIQSPTFDAARYSINGETYAVKLSPDTESETDQESHEYRIETVDSGYKGQVEIYWGYWGFLQANPGYSNYLVTYDLTPCSLSEYGVAISTITIEYIGKHNLTQGATESEQNTPFYGVWCFGSKDENDAIEFTDTLSSSDITGFVFVSTDWSNLNKERFYVVSAGVYSTEEEANDALKLVQAKGYSNAYVKFSGDYLGN